MSVEDTEDCYGARLLTAQQLAEQAVVVEQFSDADEAERLFAAAARVDR